MMDASVLGKRRFADEILGLDADVCVQELKATFQSDPQKTWEKLQNKKCPTKQELQDLIKANLVSDEEVKHAIWFVEPEGVTLEMAVWWYRNWSFIYDYREIPRRSYHRLHPKRTKMTRSRRRDVWLNPRSIKDLFVLKRLDDSLQPVENLGFQSKDFLTPLLQELSQEFPHKEWVAGSYMMHRLQTLLFPGQQLGWTPGDVDIWVPIQDEHRDAIEAWGAQHATFDPRSVCTAEEKRRNLQAIFVRGSPLQFIKQFDLNLCQVAIHLGTKKVYMRPSTLYDNVTRTVNHGNLYVTTTRYQKYQERGFTFAIRPDLHESDVPNMVSFWENMKSMHPSDGGYMSNPQMGRVIMDAPIIDHIWPSDDLGTSRVYLDAKLPHKDKEYPPYVEPLEILQITTDTMLCRELYRSHSVIWFNANHSEYDDGRGRALDDVENRLGDLLHEHVRILSPRWNEDGFVQVLKGPIKSITINTNQTIVGVEKKKTK